MTQKQFIELLSQDGYKILHFGGKDNWRCGSVWLGKEELYSW